VKTGPKIGTNSIKESQGGRSGTRVNNQRKEGNNERNIQGKEQISNEGTVAKSRNKNKLGGGFRQENKGWGKPQTKESEKKNLSWEKRKEIKQNGGC